MNKKKVHWNFNVKNDLDSMTLRYCNTGQMENNNNNIWQKSREIKEANHWKKNVFFFHYGLYHLNQMSVWCVVPVPSSINKKVKNIPMFCWCLLILFIYTVLPYVMFLLLFFQRFKQLWLDKWPVCVYKLELICMVLWFFFKRKKLFLSEFEVTATRKMESLKSHDRWICYKSLWFRGQWARFQVNWFSLWISRRDCVWVSISRQPITSAFFIPFIFCCCSKSTTIHTRDNNYSNGLVHFL